MLGLVDLRICIMLNLDWLLSSRTAFIVLATASYCVAFLLLRPLMIVDAFSYPHLYSLCLVWALLVVAIAVWHPGRLIWILPQAIAPLTVIEFVRSQEYCPEWLGWCQF